MQNPPKQSRTDPSLPADLISEILLRLPAKPIGRFRCVCKRWLRDTTDPKFIRAHASRPQNPDGFFLFTSKYEYRAEHIPLAAGAHLPDPIISFLDNEGLSPELFDSRNGLVLCRKPYRDSRFKKQPPALSVCNPLTQSHHVIHAPRTFISNEMFLAFDPSVSPHFKVVSVLGGMQGYMYIYSSETRTWKLRTDKLRTEFNNIHFGRNALWNGALLWDGWKGSILSLDMITEEMKWLPLPREELWCRYFGESRGHLHFIGNPRLVTHESITRFDIWEMKPDASGWFVLCQINIDHIKDVYPEVNVKVRSYSESQPDLRLAVVVLCFLRGEGGAGDRLLLSIPGKIVCCHLRGMSFTTVCDILPICRNSVVYSCESFYPHTHALVPLNDNVDAATLDQDWICWKREHDKMLLKLMVDKSLKGQKSGFGFRIGAWRDMLEKLAANTLMNYGVNHLKNRLMSYRRDYRTVSCMLSYEGFSWDPTRQMVIAGDAEWRKHVKGNCNVAQYLRRRVPFRELELICSSLAPRYHETSLSTIDDAEIIANTDDNGSAANEDPAIQQDDNGKGKEIQDVPGAETTKLILFDSCLEELNVMEDIDNELYVKALIIFRDEYNQHVFLKTKGVKRLMWLRAATKDVNLN